MENWTPIESTVGGLLIGLSATLMLVLFGRVAGISGILGAAVARDTAWTERRFRLLFLAGLMLGGVPFLWLLPSHFELTLDRSLPSLVVAGLLVGFGTRLGCGCTSGHGVCGMSRLSPRSIWATAVFVLCGAAMVLSVNQIFGGAL